jgi:phosphate transport system substrate-binding protein
MTPALAAAVLMAGLSGCSSDRANADVRVPAGGVLMKGAGATLPAPLYKQWFAAYQNGHPKIAIGYDGVGSGEGIRRFVGQNVSEEERVDFGASDAAMKDEEMAQVSKGVLLLPVTAGAVVLAYNLPDFDGDLRLSRKAYTGIFLGEIKNWNDRLIAETNPGKKLPKLTLATVVRQDGSGTTYAFTKHLDAISDRWRSRYGPATLVNWPGNAMRATGNEGVAGRIQQSIGSIGYVSYEFARKLGLKVAIIENKERHFVKPTEQSCEAALSAAELPENLRFFMPDPPGADAYPIVTFSWILLYSRYENAEKAKAVRELFTWCLRDGQTYASRLGYVPLPESVSARALVALNTIAPAE